MIDSSVPRATIAAAALGAAGLAMLLFGPLSLAAVGVLLALAAILKRPWLAVPLVVLSLPFHLQPRVDIKVIA